MRPDKANVRLWALGALLGLVLFAGAFAAGRSLGDGGTERGPARVEALQQRLVTINNLERAPTIKPLRSAAGAPPATAPAAPATPASP